MHYTTKSSKQINTRSKLVSANPHGADGSGIPLQGQVETGQGDCAKCLGQADTSPCRLFNAKGLPRHYFTHADQPWRGWRGYDLEINVSQTV